MARLLWTQRRDFGPLARFGHAMVFDVARKHVLMIGGQSSNGARLGDTWAWNGEHWTQVADMGPSPRSNHSMAYDESRERVVMFGGSNGDTSFRDTWEWDGEAWTQTSDSGPSARSGAAMVFISADRHVLLVGGASGGGDLLGDTWKWDGTDWTQVEDAGLPPRSDHAIAEDPPRNRVVVFGGRDVSGSLGDTWEWDGTLWSQEASFGPPACSRASMAFARSRCILYGGVAGVTTATSAPEVFGKTWEWDGRHWTALQDIGPGPRVAHAMAYDSQRERVVLFGGVTIPLDSPDASLSATGDTWDHPPELTPTQPGTIPGRIRLASFTVAPNTISAAAGGSLRFSVVLSGPAPAGGNTVLFSYITPGAVLENLPLPRSVVVASGETEKDFTVTVSPGVLPSRTVYIDAISGNGGLTTIIEVTA